MRIFKNHFGLLESEVRQLLADYHLLHCLEDFRSWYNGYRVGSCLDIYNPWSVLNCIAKKGALAPYWVNTSDNALVKRLIAQGSDDLKVDIEEFLQGGIVEKTIEEGILFSDLEKNQDLVWSLLLFSGYLTFANSPSYGTPCQLRIPNTEVGELYRTMVLEWFKTTIRESQYRLLLQSLTTGDIDTFSKIFQKFLLSSVSVFDVTHDETEKVYHAFVLGMLVGLKDTYEIKSNRESGYGRYDVMLIPKNPNDLAVIMEFKKIDSGDETDLDSGAESALKQIEEKKYSQELLTRGINRMIFLGLAFKGKLVLIRSQSITEKN